MNGRCRTCDYTVLNSTLMPAELSEASYLTDTLEEALFANTYWHAQQEAQAIFDAVLRASNKKIPPDIDGRFGYIPR